MSAVELSARHFTEVDCEALLRSVDVLAAWATDFVRHEVAAGRWDRDLTGDPVDTLGVAAGLLDDCLLVLGEAARCLSEGAVGPLSRLLAEELEAELS